MVEGYEVAADKYYVAKKDIRKALRHYKAASELLPASDCWYDACAGLLYDKVSDYLRAAEFLGKAIQKNTSVIGVYDRYSYYQYFGDKNPNAAIQTLEKGLTIDNKSAELWRILMYILKNEGMTGELNKQMKQYKALFPDAAGQ
jgi:tetratricopeptide (TPR) repeat protein